MIIQANRLKIISNKVTRKMKLPKKSIPQKNYVQNIFGQTFKQTK